MLAEHARLKLEHTGRHRSGLPAPRGLCPALLGPNRAVNKRRSSQPSTGHRESETTLLWHALKQTSP